MTYEAYKSEENYDSSENKWQDGMEDMAESIRARDQNIGAKVLDIMNK